MRLSVIEKKDIDVAVWDRFIQSEDTNGEFINTHRYLSYHPADRFHDVSCAIIDEDNQQVRCVFPAITVPAQPKNVVSHQGTSFAGPIFSTHSKVPEISEYFKLIEAHFKERGMEVLRSRCKPLLFWPKNTSREELDWVFFHRGYFLNGANLGNFIDFTETPDILFLEMCSGKRRNQIKKSLTNALVFREEKQVSKNSWSELEKNIQTKFSTSPTHSFDEISELQSRFPQNIRSFYVYSGMEYAAMAVVYIYKTVFHTQYLDLNYKFSSEYAHLFLVYHLVKIALEEKFKGFSFGPSTESWGKILNEGLYSYKRQYGGYGVMYPEFLLNL